MNTAPIKASGNVVIRFDDVSQSVWDSMARSVLSAVRESFSDEKFRGKYEKWMSERATGRTEEQANEV